MKWIVWAPKNRSMTCHDYQMTHKLIRNNYHSASGNFYIWALIRMISETLEKKELEFSSLGLFGICPFHHKRACLGVRVKNSDTKKGRRNRIHEVEEKERKKNGISADKTDRSIRCSRCHTYIG